MANTYIYDLTDTWNELATIFNAIKINVNDTLSNTDSKLIDLQLASNSKFNVGKRGNIYANTTLSSSESDAALQLDATWNTTANVTGIFLNVTNTTSGTGSLLTDIQVDGNSVFNLNANGTVNTAALNLTGNITSNSNNAAIIMGSASDLTLLREDVDTLSMRRTNNAQEFRIYNTYTDISNYERAFIKWNANILEIGSESAGTGSIRKTSLTDIAILMPNLPTSDPLVSGQLWNNGGVLTISS